MSDLRGRAELRRLVAGVKPNLADRVVSYFDPRAGAARYRARLSMALAGGYTGASRSKRSMSEWITSAGSADADLLPDLPYLRERSRDLERNSALASGAIHTVVTRTVGTGLAMQPAIKRELLGLTPEQADEWQRNTYAEYCMFALSKDCDSTRTQNFYELQDLGFRSTLVNGDALALLRQIDRSPNPYKLAIQLIEADRITNPDFRTDTQELAGGVQVDGDGAPVKYHILRTHPGDVQPKARVWDAVPAFGNRTGRRNVLHLYRKLRIGQRRGVPYLAPVIELLKQLDRYSEAEIMAAVVSGLFTVFVKSESGSGIDAAGTPGMASETGAKAGDNDVKLGPGAMIDLSPDESIETANPGRPNANFDPFFQAIVKQIGVGLELPHEVIIKAFNSSYSAARAALLDAWLFIRCRREWLATNFCQPVYEAWLDEAVAGGRIEAPGYFDDPLIRYAYCACEWVGDGPGSIDPTKEVAAAKDRILIGVSTLQKEAMLHDGGNWKDNIAQRGVEELARKAAGLPPTDAKAAVQTPAQDPNGDPGTPAAPEPGTAAP